jgi:hypothetical protein
MSLNLSTIVENGVTKYSIDAKISAMGEATTSDRNLYIKVYPLITLARDGISAQIV